MVRKLPEPARRFFQYAILPNTPLYTVAEISMSGKFGMGTKSSPQYISMTAKQVLAFPQGFIWQLNAERLTGSDAGAWTRFWMFGVIPVARMGGDLDHRRSAFGRYVAEAVFWTPAALLPQPGVVWESVNNNTAKVTVTHDGLEQSVFLSVEATGKLTKVWFPRWSNANPEKKFKTQMFVGYLSDYREFSGFRIPTHVTAGNHFETDAYFPFYTIDISDIYFPKKVK